MLSRNNMTALAGALDDMVDQARRASAILDRLRNWSRPQRRQTKHADLRLSLQNVQTLLASEAVRQGVKVELSIPETPLLAAFDPVEMEQVMFNLLRNAIESFHDSDGDRRVNASLKADGSLAILEIADNGPGVAPELLPRLLPLLRQIALKEPVSAWHSASGWLNALVVKFPIFLRSKVRCFALCSQSPMAQEVKTMVQPVYLVDDDEAVRKSLSLLLSTIDIEVRGLLILPLFWRSCRD